MDLFVVDPMGVFVVVAIGVAVVLVLLFLSQQTNNVLVGSYQAKPWRLVEPVIPQTRLNSSHEQ